MPALYSLRSIFLVASRNKVLDSGHENMGRPKTVASILFPESGFGAPEAVPN